LKILSESDCRVERVLRKSKVSMPEEGVRVSAKRQGIGKWLCPVKLVALDSRVIMELDSTHCSNQVS
jgi:hypothetical protein